MELKTRRARLSDLQKLVFFAQEEAREAEGKVKIPTVLSKGIEAALADENIALYWVLVNKQDEPVGNVSALREWSNWNAGYYWWIQSLYISPESRGKGYISLLLDAVKVEAQAQGGLDLRLYVHADNIQAIKAYKKTGFRESKYKVMIQDF